jgi:hypothetical protein
MSTSFSTFLGTSGISRLFSNYAESRIKRTFSYVRLGNKGSFIVSAVRVKVTSGLHFAVKNFIVSSIWHKLNDSTRIIFSRG